MTQEFNTVGIVLMKSEEADATLAVLERESPSVRVSDHITYWLVEDENEIRVPMNLVGEELGRPIELGQWLVIMSTFIGRAAPGADYFRVTSGLPEIEMSEPES